jgi:2Fe-2S ferredoxin
MALVTYVRHDGVEHKIDVPAGTTIMQGALANMIDGIVGDCGGGLSCATCHCYVDETWFPQVGGPSAAESDMLEAANDRRPTSRLSCQITVTDALDGLVIHLPESQY